VNRPLPCSPSKRPPRPRPEGLIALHDRIDSTLELVATYAQLIDERRFDEVEEIVTPDVVYANAFGAVKGWAELRQGMESLTLYDATYHFIGNHGGRWDGDDFHGWTYCVASHLYSADDADRKYDMGIVYREHIVRTPDGLRLKHRTLEVKWQQDLVTTSQIPAFFQDAIGKLMASS
jgi:hypothetical protein